MRPIDFQLLNTAGRMAVTLDNAQVDRGFRIEGLTFYGKLLIAAQDWAVAETVLRDVEKLCETPYPNLHDVELQLARVFEHTQRPELALVYYKSASKHAYAVLSPVVARVFVQQLIPAAAQAEIAADELGSDRTGGNENG